MKTLKTLLAAALIAGGATVAMAQGGGAGGDVNPDRTGKGSDANPTSPGANPAAGNKDAQTAGQAKTGPGANGAMKTAPVNGQNSSNPTQAPTSGAKK